MGTLSFGGKSGKFLKKSAKNKGLRENAPSGKFFRMGGNGGNFPRRKPRKSTKTIFLIFSLDNSDFITI